MLFKFEFMKTQTAFRIDEKLLELLREKAKAQKRSLNNYIEYIFYQVVGNIPNDETVQAINDARKNINLTPINDLDEYLENL